MKQPKYRAQILLEPEQHRALSDIAARREVSISHVVREIVSRYLVERDQDARKQQELTALQAMEALRGRIKQEHGVLPETLVDEVREERTAELCGGGEGE